MSVNQHAVCDAVVAPASCRQCGVSSLGIQSAAQGQALALQAGNARREDAGVELPDARGPPAGEGGGLAPVAAVACTPPAPTSGGCAGAPRTKDSSAPTLSRPYPFRCRQRRAPWRPCYTGDET